MTQNVSPTRPSGGHKALLLALLLGAALGALLHPYSSSPTLSAINTNVFAPIGQLFLRLIFMTVVPLVFSALVIGVVELGKGRGLGRVASSTLFYTLLASTLSVLIGIGLVNFFQPGIGFPLAGATIDSAVSGLIKNAADAKPLATILVELVPKNPLEAATQALSGQMLSLMVFALLFGAALATLPRKDDGSDAVISFFEQTFAASMKIVGWAMRLAPLGVFAIVFGTLFKNGSGVLASLAMYVGVVIVGLLIQQFVVYSALLKFVAKRSPREFFRACRDVYLCAFSTASSNVTLPVSLDTAERKLGLPPRVSRFVLTIGATANQNGTALFEGVTVLFLAQVYAIDLSFAQQLQVVAMSIIAGIGTAGVPGGSLPLIVILLQQVGIPAEGIGLVLGVDRLLDMCRTTLNVSGDLVIAALVGRSHDSADAGMVEPRGEEASPAFG